MRFALHATTVASGVTTPPSACGRRISSMTGDGDERLPTYPRLPVPLPVAALFHVLGGDLSSVEAPVKAWHFVGDTLRDGRPVPKDGVKLIHPGKPVLCESGLHASLRPWE